MDKNNEEIKHGMNSQFTDTGSPTSYSLSSLPLVTQKVIASQKALKKKHRAKPAIGTANYYRALKTRDRYIDLLVKKKVLNLRIVRFHALFLTLFGCGKVTYAPGTVASAITAIFWVPVNYYLYVCGISTFFQCLFWLGAITIITLYGIFAIPLYARAVGAEDHSSIVIDEVVGQLITLLMAYPLISHLYFQEEKMLSLIIIFTHFICSFTLFRFLDISKISIVGWIDQNIKGSIGVMLDDIVAGLIAGAITVLIVLGCMNLVAG